MYNKESYKHKFAKQLLIEWLRLGKIFTCYIKDQKFKIDLRNKRVFEEFPFEEGCSNRLFENIPTFEKPFCVFDILVCENGRPVYGFEIVHKHKSNEYKIQKLVEEKKNHNKNFSVYEISAEWILRLVKPPRSLKLSKILC
jgi:hypothetical protein